MPLSAAALRKRENAKLAGARVHLYYQGSGAANVAHDLSSKIQKTRTESPPDEPFGEPDFSTCLRPLRILADMLGFRGDGEMVGHVNSEDAKKLYDKMAQRIKSCEHLSIDVSTKPKQAIFGLVCGRKLRQYNDAMADVDTAKLLLESVLSELPTQPPQPVEANEAAQPEPMETEQPEQRTEPKEPAHDLMDVELGDIVPIQPLHDNDQVATGLTEQVTPLTERAGGAAADDAAQAEKSAEKSDQSSESSESGDESGDEDKQSGDEDKQSGDEDKQSGESSESGDEDESEQPQVQPQVRATTGGKRPRQRPPSESGDSDQSDQSESDHSDQSEHEDQESEHEDPAVLAAEAARALAAQQAGRAANKHPRETPARGSRGRTSASTKKRKRKLNIASTGRVYCGDSRTKAKQKAKAQQEFTFKNKAGNSMFLVVGLVARLPDDKTWLTERPLVPVPFGFNYQLCITMLAGPENYALVVQKSVGNVTQTIYVPKEEIIAHFGPRRQICTPHAGLVDAINNVGTRSRPKGHYYEYTPSRLEVDTAVHAFNDTKYRVPHLVEAVGTPAPVTTVATLPPLQVVSTVSYAAF